jgi:hypothetical protein
MGLAIFAYWKIVYTVTPYLPIVPEESGKEKKLGRICPQAGFLMELFKNKRNLYE